MNVCASARWLQGRRAVFCAPACVARPPALRARLRCAPDCDVRPPVGRPLARRLAPTNPRPCILSRELSAHAFSGDASAGSTSSGRPPWPCVLPSCPRIRSNARLGLPVLSVCPQMWPVAKAGRAVTPVCPESRPIALPMTKDSSVGKPQSEPRRYSRPIYLRIYGLCIFC